MSGCIAPKADRSPCGDPREPGSLFCRVHEQAPGVQRGGWLSAERRRLRMATSQRVDTSGIVTLQDQKLDASNVATRLWIGGRPPFDRDLPGFDLLVLCARELQPDHVAFHGTVIRCPLRDDILDHPELTRAVLTA